MLTEEETYAAARRFATNALAEIMSAQLHTWALYPANETPLDILIRLAIDLMVCGGIGKR